MQAVKLKGWGILLLHENRLLNVFDIRKSGLEILSGEKAVRVEMRVLPKNKRRLGPVRSGNGVTK